MGGGHGHGVTYKGITVHQPKRWHSVTGKGLCAVMWFWVLYRAKQDGPVVAGGIPGKAMAMVMTISTSIFSPSAISALSAYAQTFAASTEFEICSGESAAGL
ncbi:hypothetical protein HAX54_049635 [Datura stramonium]|uniref:Uncharacterized protein n=1 Tax=Datura stramonium TaxID=4076 RepID=A0ABS8SVI5_DATST|nr:hypothetical protein [Datura stramonium]